MVHSTVRDESNPCVIISLQFWKHLVTDRDNPQPVLAYARLQESQSFLSGSQLLQQRMECSSRGEEECTTARSNSMASACCCSSPFLDPYTNFWRLATFSAHGIAHNCLLSGYSSNPQLKKPKLCTYINSVRSFKHLEYCHFIHQNPMILVISQLFCS